MATTKNKSESMKNKSKMWGGDTKSQSKTTKETKSSSASNSQSKKNQSSTKSSAKSTTNKGVTKMKQHSEFAEDMTALTDVEIVSDVLSTHKGLVKLYGTALCESSCENMRDIVARQLAECGEDQFDVFQYMHDRNLYPTEEAPGTKLTKAKEKFKGFEQKMKG